MTARCDVGCSRLSLMNLFMNGSNDCKLTFVLEADN